MLSKWVLTCYACCKLIIKKYWIGKEGGTAFQLYHHSTIEMFSYHELPYERVFFSEEVIVNSEEVWMELPLEALF